MVSPSEWAKEESIAMWLLFLVSSLTLFCQRPQYDQFFSKRSFWRNLIYGRWSAPRLGRPWGCWRARHVHNNPVAQGREAAAAASSTCRPSSPAGPMSARLPGWEQARRAGVSAGGSQALPEGSRPDTFIFVKTRGCTGADGGGRGEFPSE